MHLDMVFKAFVGMMVAVVMIGSGLGVMNGFSQIVGADNYLENVSKVIVESNYNQEVINSCKAQAAENGYNLQVEVATAIKAGVRYYATIQLTYYFEIPLFGIKQEKVRMKIV